MKGGARVSKCHSGLIADGISNLWKVLIAAANDDNPLDAGFATGDRRLEGGFGGDGENHLCGLEVDDAFGTWNRALVVGRDGGSNQKRVRQTGDSSQHMDRMKRW